jgi:hypothetical protein
MMPGDPETEVLAGWRFHHSLTGIGTRNQTTLYLGTSVSTQLPPRADGPVLRRAPGFYMAAATGHISRKYYVWAGAGYERYASFDGADHLSNSLLGSLVPGWRPSFLNHDYSAADCRFFGETTGEDAGQAWLSAAAWAGASHHGVQTPLPAANSSGIIVLPSSGGRGVYTGPSFLYTHRNVALQLGVQFAAWRDPNGIQPAERRRIVAGVSYFFLGRRKMIFSARNALRGLIWVLLLPAMESARAEYLRIQLTVYGLDCEICARGVSASIGRLAA